MNNAKVRWGLIGPGRIAHTFAQDISATDNAELVAVAARDGARARSFADRSMQSTWRPRTVIIYSIALLPCSTVRPCSAKSRW